MKSIKFLSICSILFIFFSCNKSDNQYQTVDTYPNVVATFGTKIDLNNLANYANQPIPSYITKDNTNGNAITNKGATLGRVLFYDKNLSSNNAISCASCHKQENAFSDNLVASIGVNGNSARHTMRLINARFAQEPNFFWDKRATSLEMQTTMPIKNHTEMGYSGTNGDLSINDLILKLNQIGYYKELFKYVYGSEEITENKMQLALSQFIRSIQSFDSKYDAGRSQVADDLTKFPNYTTQEDNGRKVFMNIPVFDATGNRVSGGAGCVGCHRAPEFDIDPNAKNNGIINSIDPLVTELSNTRAPSLRDIVKPDGTINGPMMHSGILTSLAAVIDHYGTMNVATNNTNIDPKLVPNGFGQKLNLSPQEVQSLIAFIKTMSGTNVYTDVKWSNPFPN